MTPEAFIQQKAAAAIQAIYNTEVAPGSLQVAVTRKEFEGDYTLVTFPLLKITRQAPDATGNAIGEWLVANVPEIAAYNSVKGFLNLSFSPVYWNEALQGIAADDAFGLSIEELKETMKPEKYTGRSARQVEVFLRDVVRPILDDNKDSLGLSAEINV